MKLFVKHFFSKCDEIRSFFVGIQYHWNSSFLTNKNVRNDGAITLKEKERLINDGFEVAETLNSHYINIIETTCGPSSQALGNSRDQANDIDSVDAIISNYKHHPCINQIRKKCSNPKIYSFPEIKKEVTNMLIKRLNPKNDVIDKHLTIIINTDLECSCFSEMLTLLLLNQYIYKKTDPIKIIIDQSAF